MDRRPWTSQQDRFLRRSYGRLPLATLVAKLRRTRHSILHRARKLGLEAGRRWTESEKQFLRDNRGKLTTVEIARRLQRSKSGVYQQAIKMSLAVQHRVKSGAAFQIRLKELAGQDLCNRHIAAELHCERHTVADWRRRLGLPDVPTGGCAGGTCPRCLARVKETTKRQCQEAGVKSLAEVRALAFRRYARENGWPEDLRPRAVQILCLLYERGPMTRRQIAEAIGMRTDYAGKNGQRKILASNDPEGSYLAHLARRGLVRILKRGKQVTGHGKGRSVNLYALPIWLERSPTNEESISA